MMLLTISLSLFAFTAEEARREYDKVMLAWIDGSRNDFQILSDLGNLESDIAAITDSAERQYWTARVNLAIGQIRFYREEEKLSLDALEKSREEARLAAEGGAGADAWRIQADAGSFIMIQKGVGYIIANSGKVQDQAEKALEMDNSNVRASLIVAQGLINAPAIFGGNKRKGFAEMEALTRKPGLDPEDRFFILMGMGEIYENEKEEDKALAFYRKILDDYPENRLVAKKLTGLANR